MTENKKNDLPVNQLQYILDQIPLRVFWKDKKSCYLGCNEAFARDAGLSSAAEIVGKTDIDLPWSSSAAILREHDLNIISSGLPMHAEEEPLKDLHGLQFWLHKTKLPLRNLSGDIVGILGMYDDISSLKAAQEDDKKNRRAFNFLMNANHAVIKALNEESLFKNVCHLAVESGYMMAWVGLANSDETKSVHPVSQEGAVGDYLKTIRVSWANDEFGQGPTGLAIRESRTIVNQNFMTNPIMLPWREAAKKMGYQASIALPIAFEGNVIGALMIYAEEANAFNAEEVSLLENLGNILAFGIMGLRERKGRHEALISAVGAIAATIELRDPYTAGHQRQVANIATSIASEMGLSQEQIEGIQLAALIHDVGKVGVPAEILSKPIKLTSIERSLIQTHPEAGYELLKSIPFEWPIAEMVRQHHERLDGSGYPKGLKGEEIELGAKIIAVADVVDSMMSHRPYRPALGIDKALEELAKGRGVIFDAKVVDICTQIFKDREILLSSTSV